MNTAIETINLVVEYGVKQAAHIQGVTPYAIRKQIRNFENQMGITIFSPYDYNRVMWQGRQYLKNENIDSV